MNIRAASFRLVEVLFIAAMIVTYGGIGAGILGILDARSISLVALAATVIGALAALAFSLLWNREWRRTHPNVSVMQEQ